MVKEPEEDGKNMRVHYFMYNICKQTGTNQLIIHIILCVKNPGACMATI